MPERLVLPAEPTSYWVASRPAPRFPSLAGDLSVDVAVVGAGVTGLTVATLLARAGLRVAVLEARRVAEGVSGGTTAHLTEAIDTRYKVLRRDFGAEGAALAAAASRAAIDAIESLAKGEGIACGFRRLPGYLYTERDEALGDLHEEYEAAKACGVDVTMGREVPLPFPAVAGVRFAAQAQFHPRDYLVPLAEKLAAGGHPVFEDTRAEAVEDGRPCRVVTARGTVTATHVIEATHAPLNRVFLQTKIAHYRSYVLALQVAEAPLEGLFWDTEDPYHYLRSETRDGRTTLLVGGEDHKTGEDEATLARSERLLAYAQARFPVTGVTHRWSAQVIEPVDGLPFIGPNSFSKNVFVATGFSGNGFTFGTVAALLLTDLVTGRESPWAKLFDATRVKPLASALTYLRENADVPRHLVGDRLRGAEASSVAEVGRGEGKMVRVNGRKLAVHRDDAGAIHALGPICPHLGCEVHWNDGERTWDCPCHGSRFDTRGEVIDGPATAGLTKVNVGAEGAGEPTAGD